jgi:hypothetical protein
MAFEIKTRYGYIEKFNDNADSERITEGLIQELETEQFDEPDDEHTQIAVSYENLAVIVDISGLIILDDLSSITGSPEDILSESFYIRDLPRTEVFALLVELAKGNISKVRDMNWLSFDKLPPYERDFFRQNVEDDLV